jgi:undecaprenyl-diphosphatase
MDSLDIAATQFINGWAGQSAAVDGLMLLVTQWGVPTMIAAVALTWWQKVRNPVERHVAVCAGLAVLLSLAINQLILLFVHRTRPYDADLTHLVIGPSADPSFPSDHATAACAIVVTFMLHRRWIKSALFLVAAILLMVSRVYVGTHYVSDILGGAATALAACLLVTAFYREGSCLDDFVTGIF